MSQDTIEKAFKDGMAMARDPRNAQCRHPDEIRTTTIYSPWLLQVCQICHHTFREDDHVLPDPEHPERMLHADARSALHCWSRAQRRVAVPTTGAPANMEIRTAFLQGLHAHWCPTGNRDTELVQPGSPLIGRRCPICRHTVRIGDQVVRCPCGRQCGGVFHQDITRHLTCWDAWNRGEQRTYCALTGAAFVAYTTRSADAFDPAQS
jgi:hypothetical protein